MILADCTLLINKIQQIPVDTDLNILKCQFDLAPWLSATGALIELDKQTDPWINHEPVP
jgi:hypothetical protein